MLRQRNKCAVRAGEETPAAKRREQQLPQEALRLLARSKSNRGLRVFFRIAVFAALVNRRIYKRGPAIMLYSENSIDSALVRARARDGLARETLATSPTTTNISFARETTKEGNGGSETPVSGRKLAGDTMPHQPPNHLPRLLNYNSSGSYLKSKAFYKIMLNRKNYQYKISQEEREGWENDPWDYFGFSYNPTVDETHCVPMRSWQMETHPTCNDFHVVDMTGGDDLRYIGSGGWRTAESLRMGRYGQWVPFTEKDAELSMDSREEHEYDINNARGYQEEEVIFKYVHWRHVNYEEEVYHIHRMDAIIADRLGSKKTIPIHGHCGVSALYQKASPYHLEKYLRKRHNNMTSQEKLRLSIELAEALANIHGIDAEGNVTIAHRDFKPENVLVGNDGKMKVMDFNDATVLYWNTTSNRQCGFGYTRFPPHWAAGFKPHEQALGQMDLTEKIDVYALGGFLFLMLTGSPPFFKFDTLSQTELREVVLNGTMPLLPDRYTSTKDVAIRAIISAFTKCFQYRPSDRPSARQVEMELKSAMKRVVARTMRSHVASHARP